MNELYHYGVKGMKWGVRRKSSQKGQPTSHKTKQEKKQERKIKKQIKRENKIAINSARSWSNNSLNRMQLQRYMRKNATTTMQLTKFIDKGKTRIDHTINQFGMVSYSDITNVNDNKSRRIYYY